MRRICFDTETTGLSWRRGDRLCEIGAVLLDDDFTVIDSFHTYVNPMHPVGAQAYAIHGLSDEFLATQPPFEAVAKSFLDFVSGAELIAHNATFDTGFVNAHLGACGLPGLKASGCEITCTFAMARRLFPSQRNSLDALCQRFGIDASARVRHGALLDAQLLARVYAALINEQKSRR